MRTFHSRTAALTATGTALLALALTACGPDPVPASPKAADPKPAGTAASAPAAGAGVAPEAPAPAAPAAPGGSAPQGVGTGTGAGTGKGAEAGKGSGAAQPATAAKPPVGPATAATPLCTVKDLAISAARKDGPPYTHIVLTAKNTSGHSCQLSDFPQIQFLESHRENVPAVARSKPSAPVVLTPGAPAYALVRLSNGGVHEDNEPVSAFSVTLGGGGGTATVKSPGAGGIAVDPAVWATGYWTPELRNGADDF
ncbi:DUF4232 domain-containing protein [Kitasatospora sp. NPDC058170]|uniref:DUF4232 domain-containing protein n=1 Tax=Kitasatospora sp. NPDC058170 TaxID=3346364 RepID=UPI0036D9BBFF